MSRPNTPILDRIHVPSDMKGLSNSELETLAHELRSDVARQSR